MLQSLKRIFVLASITATEIFSKPVSLLLFLTASFATLTVPIFQFQQFSEECRLARDSGLAVFFLFGILFTCYAAGSQITADLENGIASAALVKPLHRIEWFIGKCLGIFKTVLRFFEIQILSIILAETISPHYKTLHSGADFRLYGVTIAAIASSLLTAAILHRFFEKRFVLNACRLLPAFLCVAMTVGYFTANAPFGFGTFPAAFLILSALIPIIFLAALLSIKVKVGVVSGCIFSFLLLGFLKTEIPFSEIWLAWLPDFSLFWQSDALSKGGKIPLVFIFECLMQSLCFCVAYGIAGSWILQKRDIG